ncbi:hypothetical protein P280DRAFT_253528 [Massarina eburnea CBS 473.64]|uniref:Uncharacterized protein n=1 Tax=Massarina eburnea CBS 473.64 TaxID=1395130 RepID=A0A6A6S728_9PLEO|nr:hypothetical protein P280DRAFT_253528 [Massarina eburnea CBS 473.64]
MPTSPVSFSILTLSVTVATLTTVAFFQLLYKSYLHEYSRAFHHQLPRLFRLSGSLSSTFSTGTLLRALPTQLFVNLHLFCQQYSFSCFNPISIGVSWRRPLHLYILCA